VYVPFPLSVGCGAVTVLAPLTLTTRLTACPVTRLLFPSRTVITMLVAVPATPDVGTVALEFVGLGVPGPTTLVYGLPLIAVPPSVIATLSVPTTVGV
jgi:hypothetical protein